MTATYCYSKKTQERAFVYDHFYGFTGGMLPSNRGAISETNVKEVYSVMVK